MVAHELVVGEEARGALHALADRDSSTEALIVTTDPDLKRSAARVHPVRYILHYSRRLQDVFVSIHSVSEGRGTTSTSTCNLDLSILLSVRIKEPVLVIERRIAGEEYMVGSLPFLFCRNARAQLRDP